LRPDRTITPGYTPDGRHLYWTESSGAGHLKLVLADPDGSNERVVRSDIPAVVHTVGWTADSRFATLSTGSGWWIVAATGELLYSGALGKPSLSPNGSRIAVMLRPPTSSIYSGGEIWVTDLDGSNRVLITGPNGISDPWLSDNPIWSADGTQIAWWSRFSSPGVDDLAMWVSNADGSSRFRLGDAPGGGLDHGVIPHWAPQTNTVTWQVTLPSSAFASPQYGSKVGSMGATADTFMPDETAIFVGWSPDESRAAVLAGGQVQIVDYPSRTILVSSPQQFGLPGPPVRWASDGTFALLNNSAGTQLQIFDRSGSLVSTTKADDAYYRPCPPFGDISAGSFAAMDIALIEALGITHGTSPITFDPANNVTREQMAAFLARTWVALANACPTGQTPFTDVDATSYAAAPIRCIFGLGITRGTSLTTYSPKGLVTREQMAAFLERFWLALGNTCPAAQPPFTDIRPDSFARSSVSCIYGLGITTGTAPTLYSPGAFVTREQMAAFLARLWRKS